MTLPSVRGYWELAEATHPGPLRLYARELEQYLEDIKQLVGTDEHTCEICGVPNVRPDGTQRVFFWRVGDRSFCDQHYTRGNT